MGRLPWARRIAGLASLADARRLELFEIVAASPGPVGRDEVARAAGIPRSTASFQLDRLAEDGLLAVEFRKPPGRTGPGSGRPAKLYRPVAREVSASVPDRNYDLAGEILAAAVERCQADGIAVETTLPAVAFGKGSELAQAADSLEDFLVEAGYGPEPDGDGGLLLQNCPFHRLSQAHRGVVCTMNAAFLKGAASGCGTSEERVAEAVEPGGCCARITPPPA